MTFITLGGKNFLRDPSFKNKKAVVYTHNGLLAAIHKMRQCHLQQHGCVPRVLQTRWSESDGKNQKAYNLTHVQQVKKETNEQTKQEPIRRHRHQTGG